MNKSFFIEKQGEWSIKKRVFQGVKITLIFNWHTQDLIKQI